MKCLQPLKMVNKRYKTDRYKGVPTSVLQGKIDYYLSVPCGRCPACVKRKMADWRFRLHQEYKYNKRYKYVSFLTFTLDDKAVFDFHLSQEEFIDRSTALRPFSRFRDRYRKKYGEFFRYFVVTEFGESTGRFHYHAVIWHNSKLNESDWSNVWKYGFIWLGECNSKTISYVTKYITKNVFNPKQQFVFVSPGFGRAYLTDSVKQQIHDFNLQIVVNSSTNGNFKYVLPQYYRRKIWTDEERHIMLQDYLRDVKNGVFPKIYKGRQMHSLEEYLTFLENEKKQLLKLIKHY